MLLELLDIKGCIITADAMSCQKEIVATIIKKEADYTIGLKDNQPTLSKAAQEHFDFMLEKQYIEEVNDSAIAVIEKAECKEVAVEE